MTPAALPVTFDVNVLVAAAAGSGVFWAWPSPPPLTGNLPANCIGVINDAQEFSLWLSPHVLTNLLRVLADLGWPEQRAGDYALLLKELAEASGGGILEPAVRVDDCLDYEDNRILELAFASGSVLIVSEDSDLLEMPPWRGIPIVTSRAFAARVDAMRRASRR